MLVTISVHKLASIFLRKSSCKIVGLRSEVHGSLGQYIMVLQYFVTVVINLVVSCCVYFILSNFLSKHKIPCCVWNATFLQEGRSVRQQLTGPHMITAHRCIQLLLMIDFCWQKIVSCHHHRSMRLKCLPWINLDWLVKGRIARKVDWLVSTQIFSRCKSNSCGLHKLRMLVWFQITSWDKICLVGRLLSYWFYLNFMRVMWVSLFNICAGTRFTTSYRKFFDWGSFAIITCAEKTLQRGIRFPLKRLGHYFQ